MGKTFRETLAEQLKDPEFKKVWDAGEAERERLQAQIKCENMTDDQAPIIQCYSGENKNANKK